MARRAVHTRSIRAAVRSLFERLEERQLLSSGQLLSTFGNAGTLVLPDNLTDRGAAVCATLGDSLFVALDNQVTKLTPAGQPDPTFGIGGVFTVPAGTVGPISALAVQPDGRLLLTLTDNPSTDAQVMRLLPNGQPDSSWGNRGIIVFDFTLLRTQARHDITSVASSLLLQPDGKVVVGGMEFAQTDSTSKIALARFNSDGTPDVGFGDNGTATFLPGAFIQNIVTTMRLQSDGQIVVLSADAFNTGGGQLVDYALSRFSAAGVLDTTFAGNNGFVAGTSDNVHNLVPVGFQIDSTGRFVVAANQYADPVPAPALTGGFLVRYSSAGVQDSLFGTFGNNGILTLPAGLSTKGISALTLASDDSILVGTGDSFRIAGFTTDNIGQVVFDPNIPTDAMINPPAGQTARVDQMIFATSGTLYAVGAISDPANASGPMARIAAAAFKGDFGNKPIIKLTGPTAIAEDQPITFTYTTHIFGNHAITGYQWDYNYNGTFVADASGPNPVIPPGQWFGGSSHTIAVRVIDSGPVIDPSNPNNVSNVFPMTIAVTNVAPVASITQAGPRVIQNEPATFNLGAVYYKAPDEAAGQWTIDWGDSSSDTISGSPASALHATGAPGVFNTPASHTYTASGTYTITASYTDAVGSVSNTVILVVTTLDYPQIAGFVFNDANRDGIQTTGELGIAGVQVFLDANANGVLDQGETVTTTDANGYYQFSSLPVGTYTVAIVKPDPLFNTLPQSGSADSTVTDVNTTTTTNFGLADYYVVTGTVFIDNNNNGVQDEGEGGLAGAVVFADINNNGILDANEPSTVSASDGSFTLVPIHQANTIIRANLPAGYVLTTNLDGATASPALFGALGQAPVIGSVFEDRNGDGIRALNDPGVAGVTVYVDANNNNQLDPGEISTTTNSSGMFTLPNVTPGDWWVRVVTPSGYHFQRPSLSSAYITRTLNAPVYGVSLPMLRNNTITGLVFNDANADGIRQSAEKPMSNLTVFLDTNGNGQREPGEPVAFTNSTGRYTFSTVTTPNPRIGIQVPPGYRLTTDLSQPLPPISSGQNYNQDIGLTQRISVSGGVFFDANKNGVWNLNEAGLRGFRVYIDSNNNGTFDPYEPSVLTDSQGRFAFNNLLPGTYTLRVVPVATWQKTTPALGAYTMIVKAGQVVQKRNFGFNRATRGK